MLDIYVIAIVLVTVAITIFFIVVVSRGRALRRGTAPAARSSSSQPARKSEPTPREPTEPLRPPRDPSAASGQPKVFISHSSKDKSGAETLCAALEKRGLQCWFADRDVYPGDNFQESIHRAIRAAKVMVLVFSKNANTSPEINKEIALAGQYQLWSSR